MHEPIHSGEPTSIRKVDQDGVTHINIDIRAKTPLGRMLSSFYDSPFQHVRYGKFRSMEAFWHWVRLADQTSVEAAHLRKLSGHKAKVLGSQLPKKTLSRDIFQRLIEEGNYCKIRQNPEIMKEMIASTLPFDLYFLSNGECIRSNQLEWQLVIFERIRNRLKNEC